MAPSVHSLQQQQQHHSQMATLQGGGVPMLGDNQASYVDPMALARQSHPAAVNNPFSAIQQQQQQQSGYPQNLHYATASSLHSLMVPPPSPTVLSYYTADPNQWMSLLNQNTYQPQAYHYEHPVPPHQLAFNFAGHQQMAPLGYGVTNMQVADPSQQQQQQAGHSGQMMLLTQQFAPHPLSSSQLSLQVPPISSVGSLAQMDQAMHQNNIVAAQMAAAAAATAVGSGQYAIGGHPHVHQSAVAAANSNGVGVGLQFSGQQGGGGQQQQSDGFYQQTRKSASFTNLATLQQQPGSASGYVRPEFNAQYAAGGSTSLLGGSAGLVQTLQQQQQQHLQSANGRLQPLNVPRSHGGLSLSSLSRMSLGHSTHKHRYHHQQQQQQQIHQIQQPENLPLFGAGVKAAAVIPQQATSEVVPGTRIRLQQALDENVRDHILQTAHQLYSSNARNPVLIDMLQRLHQLHPRHLPTLLLLACAYFSSGQAGKSLEYNEAILEIDGNYVEAMSNIGTTLRSMGRAAEAEAWWWRAVKLRPGYWDAVENLMGVLCGNSSGSSGNGPKDTTAAGSADKAAPQPRYKEALQLCEFVDGSLRIADAPARYQVQDKQLRRLQSLLYSEGNLRLALGDVGGARREYEKAVDVVLGGQLRLEDVVVRVAGLGAQGEVQGEGQDGGQAQAQALDSLPLTLLPPDKAVRVAQALFPATRGVLPGFAGLAAAALQQANQVAANLLLALAKLHQDHALVVQPLAVVLPLYYLALALAPSPSTCNNLGIIL
ncbi:hypothetical protein GGF37_004929, partial [Kickxella alabastrina]